MFATAIEKNIPRAEVVSYRMQVMGKIDTYNYWIREIRDDGQAGQPYLWRECIEPSHPDFDPGMTVVVWTKDLGCKSFYDQQHTGWKVFRDAEGKFIDWRAQ
jgi:hypothetical protein